MEAIGLRLRSNWLTANNIRIGHIYDFGNVWFAETALNPAEWSVASTYFMVIERYSQVKFSEPKSWIGVDVYDLRDVF